MDFSAKITKKTMWQKFLIKKASKAETSLAIPYLVTSPSSSKSYLVTNGSTSSFFSVNT